MRRSEKAMTMTRAPPAAAGHLPAPRGIFCPQVLGTCALPAPRGMLCAAFTGLRNALRHTTVNGGGAEGRRARNQRGSAASKRENGSAAVRPEQARPPSLPLQRGDREAGSTAAESHSTEAEKGHGGANTALSAMRDKHQTQTQQAPCHTQNKGRSRTGTRTPKASWHVKQERAPRRGKYSPRHGTLQAQTWRHGADSSARATALRENKLPVAARTVQRARHRKH